MDTDMDRLLLAAKKLKSVESPADLARFLNVSDQVITNWKARGIPRGELLDVAEAIGCNVYWLKNGTGLMEVIYAENKEQALTLEQMKMMSKESERYMVKIGVSLAQPPKQNDGGT